MCSSDLVWRGLGGVEVFVAGVVFPKKATSAFHTCSRAVLSWCKSRQGHLTVGDCKESAIMGIEVSTLLGHMWIEIRGFDDYINVMNSLHMML